MDSFCDQNQQTHVLLVTLPAHGHLNPLLTLGKCLVSKGLHVTLATINSTLKNSYSPGGVHLEFFSDGLPKDYNRKANIDDYMDTLSKFAPVNLLALIRSHPSKFSCIMGTPFVPWVADVAEEVGVPNAMLWIQPCTLYQIYHRYYNRLDEFPTLSNQNTSVKLPGLPVFNADELPSFVLPTNKAYFIDRMLHKVFHSMHKVKWVLGNTFMELEKDVIMSLSDYESCRSESVRFINMLNKAPESVNPLNGSGANFWPVGPLVPAKLLGKEEVDGIDVIKLDGESNCIEWLNKQKPSSVVYISFGTILSLSEKELESMAAGLKKINRPFLWVIRSRDNQELKELRFLEEIKEQGLVVNWSPQTEVLSHPSVGCFLSHCGWNSLLESVAAGVPVIACPKWSDQPTNAKMVTDVWGVGVRMKKSSEGGISGEEVGRCVEEVMSGPRSQEFRRNAMALKTAAREAVADGGSSDKSIELFVNEVVSSSSSYTYSEQK